MALAAKNIEINEVMKYLGYTGLHLVFAVCSSELINKWSKYKPVRDVVLGVNWPAGASGKYGFNLPENWDYLQPRSGSRGGSENEPGGLEQFRGYEHSLLNAFPAIQCRDTDNVLNEILYPSGSTYIQRWYCRGFREASDVIIVPSDLGIDDYYIGLRLAFGGAVHYKTFGQVKDLVNTKTWNFTVSAELVAGPAYSDFPFGDGHGGACDWELILCENATTGWQNSLAGEIFSFPAGTDGVDVWMTSGSFTVAQWLALSAYALIFSGAAGYEEVTVLCSTESTPAFTVSDDQSWITISVYDGETLIANPALWLSGMKVRVTVSALTTACVVSPVVKAGEDWTLDPAYTSGSLDGNAERDGNVTVSSEGVDKVITVAQGSAGSDQLTFAFRAVNLGAGDTDIDVVIKRGETTVFSDLTGAYHGRDGFTKTYTVTINETGVAGDTYVVTLSRHI